MIIEIHELMYLDGLIAAVLVVLRAVALMPLALQNESPLPSRITEP
jgi:hypothetical protein